MTDVVDAQTRSRMMAGIRSSNTKPEKLVRTALHRRGLRFARSSLGLAGRPDAVMPRWKVVVFVNGCFWHLHGCNLSKIPSSNPEFWTAKLFANKARDKKNFQALVEAGWHILTVWECALRGPRARVHFDQKMDEVTNWVRDPEKSICCDVSSNGLVYRKGIDESN